MQIIPWMLADSNHMPIRMQWLDPRKTVFVGALHGMLNAEGLATIFGDLFGGTTIVQSCFFDWSALKYNLSVRLYNNSHQKVLSVRIS